MSISKFLEVVSLGAVCEAGGLWIRAVPEPTVQDARPGPRELASCIEHLGVPAGIHTKGLLCTPVSHGLPVHIVLLRSF